MATHLEQAASSTKHLQTIDVTHVIPYMHPRSGGPPVVVDRFCRQLRQQDWNVQVVTTNLLAGKDGDAWQEAYRQAYPLDVHRASGPGHFAYSADLRRSLDHIIARSRLVNLHTVWTYPSLVAARACRQHGVPYVVMPHGMLDPASLGRKPWKKQLYGKLIEWRNLRGAAGMIYTHEEERRLAEQTVSGLPPGYLVPLGADDPPPMSRENLAAQFFTAHPELQGKELVVFLSRLHSKKGLDILIPAMKQLAQLRPDSHLLLVGQGSPEYEAELRRLAAECGVSERITWTGNLSGVAKWEALAAGSVMALSSYQENFALVVVEALRLGVPVVLSRRVNICEDVVHSGAGLECELNPESVARQLAVLLADPARRAIAGQCGQKLVAERFTWPRAAEALISAYQAVLAET